MENNKDTNLTGLTNILLHISDKNQKNTCIYISIGSSASTVSKDALTGNWTISNGNNQQFPPFLKNLKRLSPSIPIHIILIDPNLENPPFIVWDGTDNNTKPSSAWLKSDIYQKFNIEHYENIKDNINVYVLRKYVVYDPYENNDYYNGVNAINISLFLTLLDMESIEQNWFTVVNDFSGIIMSKVALVHDQILKTKDKNHLDHIIYGLGARKDGGCNFDLTQPECDFVYNITSDGIKVFNPFCSTCHDNDMLQSLKYLADMPDANEKHRNDYLIAITQIGEFIKYKRRIILYEIMTLVRQFGKLIKHPDQIDKNSICPDNLYIKITYGINLHELYKDNRYSDIFYHCINILKEELKEHIYVIYGKNTNEIVEKIVLNMILTSDPYQWYNQISELLRDFDNKTGKQIKIEYA